MAEEPKTIVEYFSEHEAYKCGYCGKSDTNYSHGMWAHSMTVQDYQHLLDRGWRRSGKYCYKPSMDILCCPMYAIRCEALKFTLRKSHKKVLKKVNKFLIDGVQPSRDKDDDEVDMSAKKSVANPATSENQSTAKTQSQLSCGHSTEETMQDVVMPRKGDGADPNKPPCKKAKDRRKEKKLEKLAAKGSAAEASKQKDNICNKGIKQGKTLEEYLAEPDKAQKCAHKLEIRLVRSYPPSQEFEDTLTETHKIYHKYQMAIHGDPADKPNMRQFSRFLIDSPLEIRFVRTYPKSEEFKSTYGESYKVYKKYQMRIHKDGEDECSQSSYNGFLVDSPLETKSGGSLPKGYGSFHQQYILDGKLICVGVIDILPSLVSSKYLYYDPDYQYLSLGTYSTLVELALVRELHKHSQELIYYYMGYYIQSCPKMKYKGQYHPSFLLCPETYGWHPIEKCSPMLEQKNYCRFEEDESKGDDHGQIDLENVLVLFQRQIMTYPIYKLFSKGKNNDDSEVKEYAGFVGSKCANRILLFRK